MLRSTLVLGFVCALVGCDAEPDAGRTGSTDTGKADDLIGGRVSIRGSDPITPSIPASIVIAPVVNEIDAGSVELFTRDIRVAAPAPGSTLNMRVDLTDTVSATYAFQLEYRLAGSDQWRVVRPAGSVDFYWDRVTLTNRQGTVRLDGVALKVTDWIGGLSQQMHVTEDALMIPEGAVELRVLAIPIWNFWDWDSGGYLTRIIIR